jgi:DNA-binding transcriptional LysR family regulator
MTLHQIKIFLALARFRSFTRAAEDLGMSQPDVSVHVRNLQDELGVRLYEIVGKRTYLTEAGEALRQKGEQIFAQLQETEQLLSRMKGLLSGSFLIGAGTTIAMYILPNPLTEFGRKYPGINTHLRTGSSGAVEKMVASMEIELGFTIGLPIPQVKSRTFMKDEIVVILRPRHRLAKRRELSVAELLEENFVMRGAGSASWRFFEHIFPDRNSRPRVQMELDSTQAVKWAVANGVGISLVPKHAVVQELESGLLRIAHVKGYRLSCPLNIVTHPQRKLSPIAEAFLQIFAQTSDLGAVGTLRRGKR